MNPVHFRRIMATGPAALARAVHSNPELVFVYCTLKRGHGNHHWLIDAPFLGESVLPDVVLHDLGYERQD